MKLLTLCTILTLLALVLSSPFAQAEGMHTPKPVDLAVQERALALLSDVVGLDLSRYNITLRLNQSWNFAPDLPSKQMLIYNLTSDQNVLDASFESTDNTGIALTMLSVVSGRPLFVDPAEDILDEAKALLERYMNFSEVDYIQDMRYMLDAVTKLESMKVIRGNITLQITHTDFSTTFKWTHTVNNITNMHSGFGIQFQNKIIYTVNDKWTTYEIPNPQLDISEKEAINRTVENGETYANQTGHLESKLLYNKAYATLSFQPRNGKLYPQWEVFLPIQKTPPGPIPVSSDDPNYEWYRFYHDSAVTFYNSNRTNGIHVTMWADTGEVARVYTDVSSETPPTDDLPTIILTDTNNEEAHETTNPTLTQELATSPTPDIISTLSPNPTVPEFPAWIIPTLLVTLAVFIVIKRRLKT